MELCSVLFSWVIDLSDYERVEGCPTMQTVPHEWLQEQACGGRKCRVLGWYPGRGGSTSELLLMGQAPSA